MRRGPDATRIDPVAHELSHLEAVVRQATSPQRAIMRVQIVLLADEQMPNTATSEPRGIHRTSVVRRHDRFAEDGLVRVGDPR